MVVLFVAASSFAQTGSLKGIVKDYNTKNSVSFAKLSLEKNGIVVKTVTSDNKGQFNFFKITVGTYTLRVSSVAYILYVDYNIKIKENTELEKIILLRPKQNFVLDEVVVKEDCEEVKDLQLDHCLPQIINKSIVNPSYQYCSPMGVVGDMSYQQVTQNYNTEEYDIINENIFHDVINDPLSTFSIDVDKASYSNLRRFINGNQKPPVDAIRIEEMINYFDYDYPQPKDEHPFSVNMEMNSCPWNSEHELVLIGLQAKIPTEEEIPASNLVFLVDVSGSMSSANKLPLLVQSFKILVEKLRPQDRVAMVVYAGAAGLVLKSTSGNNKKAILKALNSLQSGGSTAGGAGIKLAYKVAVDNFIEGGNNRVILATDGDFNVGQSSNADMERLIIEKRKTGIYLSVLGFGMGNYKDSKMEKLSNAGNGNYAYIDNILEAKKVFGKELWGTLYTVAKDVKIQVEFNPAKVKSYRLIGYENRLLNKEDFNDDKKDAGEIGAGHKVTALYEIIPAGSNENPNNVDPLEYQNTIQVKSNNLMTLKLRYKLPDENKSRLIKKYIKEKKIQSTEVSDNFMFASAVVGFGMLLRNSQFKGDLTFNDVEKLARLAKGKDENGYRAEFITLVEKAELIFAED